MALMSHQRYGCWSAQAPPPLPRKRRGDAVKRTTTGFKPINGECTKEVREADVLLGGESASIPSPVWQKDASVARGLSSGSLAFVPFSGHEDAEAHTDLHLRHSLPPNVKGGEVSAPIMRTSSRASELLVERIGPKTVHDVVSDPSKWILRDQETGQELDAQAFVEAVMMLTAPRHNPFNVVIPRELARQLPLGAPWTGRRRSSSQKTGRPTHLAPPGASGLVDIYNPSQSFFCQSSKSPRRSRSPMSSRAALSLPNVSSRTSVGMTSTISGDQVFRLSRVRPAQVLRDLHVGGILTMCFSPTGDYLATAGADHRALVFKMVRRRDGSSSGGPPHRPGTGGLLSLMGIISDGGPSAGDSVRLPPEVHTEWRMRLVDEVPMRVLSGHVGDIVALGWAPDESALLTGSADGTVRCWRPREGDECTAVYEHGGRVTSVSWDPTSVTSGQGGGRFLTGCMDGKLRIFSADSVEPHMEVLAERPVTAVAFAPGGAAFVAGLVGGSVLFYRTEGMVQELAGECRRHGLRLSAANIKPTKRMSVGGGTHSKGNGIARRKNTRTISTAGSSGTTEERVTGLCFRPQARVLSDGVVAKLVTEVSSCEAERQPSVNSARALVVPSVDDLPVIVSPASAHGGRMNSDEHENETSTGDDSGSKRVPASTISKERESSTSGDGKNGGSAWVGSGAEILVSTNDSRVRVLEPGRAGGVAVRLKLKGHNTEGVLGRHAVAGYSEDGELVISGSADGYVHVWPALRAGPSTTPRRPVAWPNHREGHERVLVCGGKVAVPSALFAPDNLAQSISGEGTRIIVTGDAEGSLKVFVG